jgi:hypothetical protein
MTLHESSDALQRKFHEELADIAYNEITRYFAQFYSVFGTINIVVFLGESQS